MKKGEEKDYSERFGAIRIPVGFTKSIWIHCASVGEVRSISHLVNKMRKNLPEHQIVISTTTSTGKYVAIDELKPDLAFLMPLENSMAISMLIDALRCKAMMIVDTELWPNTIYTASKKTNLYMINGRISDRSYTSYKRLSFIFRPLLKKFDYIYVKSDADVEKFSSIKGSTDNIENAGNLKYNFDQTKTNKSIPDALKNKRFAMASSTHENEESFFLKAISAAQQQFDVLVIAPRHLNRLQQVIDAVSASGKSHSLLSENQFDKDVLIIDQFGQLEPFYATADKIFIGGSTNGTGGHNIFEAIQYHKVPAVGPNMHNFEEIYQLAKTYQTVETIHSEAELSEYFDQPNQQPPDFNGLFTQLEKTNRSADKIIELLKGHQ
jgi:3-deoxy-D-manno-octulosonic-acid transferase